MNILLLNANLRGVGTYVRALNFGWALATAGHTVTLCTVSPTEPTNVVQSEARGVTILEMPRWGYKLLPGWGSGPLDIIKRVQLIRGGRFDVLYGFEYHPNVAWPVYLTWAGRSYRFFSDWCDWHAGGSNTFRGVRLAHRVDAFFEERIRYRAERVTVISTLLRERTMRMGLPSERVTLIEEGVDTDYIRPLPRAEMRARFGLPVEAPILVTISDSDMHRPVAILAEVRRHWPTAILLIIGKKLPEATQAADAPGLRAVVRETGYVPDEDLPRYLACADVCFLPLADTLVNRARWPHKINDFLAAGQATVISPVGDITQLFRDHDLGGLANTDTEFAAQITALLDDPARRAACGRRARQVALERLDWRLLREEIVRLVS